MIKPCTDKHLHEGRRDTWEGDFEQEHRESLCRIHCSVAFFATQFLDQRVACEQSEYTGWDARFEGDLVIKCGATENTAKRDCKECGASRVSSEGGGWQLQSQPHAPKPRMSKFATLRARTRVAAGSGYDPSPLPLDMVANCDMTCQHKSKRQMNQGQRKRTNKRRDEGVSAWAERNSVNNFTSASRYNFSASTKNALGGASPVSRFWQNL